MSSKKKSAGAAVAMCMTVGVTLLGFATPASAASDCKTTITNSGRTGNAKCTGGNSTLSKHRVKVVCISQHGTKFNVWGPYKNTRKGETSSATCSTGWGAGVHSVGVETEEPW
ncbi:hypothetical protein ACWGI0_15980 [Streptomyces sp. NPDC054802]